MPLIKIKEKQQEFSSTRACLELQSSSCNADTDTFKKFSTVEKKPEVMFSSPTNHRVGSFPRALSKLNRVYYSTFYVCLMCNTKSYLKLNIPERLCSTPVVEMTRFCEYICVITQANRW